MIAPFICTSKSGKKIECRTPTLADTELMRDYINTLSMERTFIRFQGEQVSYEDELGYVTHQLQQIQEHRGILLLAFHGEKLVGISGIDMSDKTERHIGLFGISIAKEYRGDGIGMYLMQHTLNEAVRTIPSLEIVTLYYFSHNSGGEAMYRKLGFVQCGVLPRGTKLERGYADHVMMYKTVRDLD